MALAVARDRLDKVPNWAKPREGFGTDLCQEVREILDEPSFRHVVRKSANYVDGERKSPSDNVIRDIWTSFIKNGTPARANNGGRHRNEEARAKIKELLEKGDNYSSREIAALTGASRALVCNAIKEFKGLARKRGRSKAAAPMGAPDSSSAANPPLPARAKTKSRTITKTKTRAKRRTKRGAQDTVAAVVAVASSTSQAGEQQAPIEDGEPCPEQAMASDYYYD